MKNKRGEIGWEVLHFGICGLKVPGGHPGGSALLAVGPGDPAMDSTRAPASGHAMAVSELSQAEGRA